MKYTLLIGFIFIVLSGFVACSYEFPDQQNPGVEDLGTLNAEKVIAIGDGFTAGVMDGALYSDGQENSLAALINRQIALLSGQDFQQAQINSENGYNLFNQQGAGINGRWIYRYLNNTDELPVKVLSEGEAVGMFTGDKKALQNLAIPGLAMRTIDGTELRNNPFFQRIFDSESKDYSSLVADKDPSLVFSWIGMHDFIDFAINGATQNELLTSIDEFEKNYSALLQTLIENTSAKIVLVNLISFRDLPYFYLRQYNFIRLSNIDKSFAQATYDEYNRAVAQFNIGKPYNERRQMISFEDNGATLYPQPLVVIDDDMPAASNEDGSPLENYRQLNENELALLSISDEMVEDGWGWRLPLPSNYYLSENQIEKLDNAFATFNAILFELASKYPERIVFVDLGQEVKKIADTGKYDSWGFVVSDKTIYADGVPLEAGLGINSIFSLDGIHFNQRGNALIANLIIDQINTSFKANIPAINVNNYVGNVYSY